MTQHTNIHSTIILKLNNYKLRDYQPSEDTAVNYIALFAFKQFENQYSDWPSFSNKIANMAMLAEHAELFVAHSSDKIVGAVAYVASGKPKQLFPLSGLP